jgi:hypothetical protein
MKLKRFYAEYGEPLLGSTAPDLYELQRVLQQNPRFLKGRPGPGGGADATPFAVAQILIALLAGGPRRQASRTVHDYSDLPIWRENVTEKGQAEGEVTACPLTRATNFGDAMLTVLSNPPLARNVSQIVVCRDWREASINYYHNNVLCESQFVGSRGMASTRRAEKLGTLFNLSRLGGQAVTAITEAIAKNTQNKPQQVPTLKPQDELESAGA